MGKEINTESEIWARLSYTYDYDDFLLCAHVYVSFTGLLSQKIVVICDLAIDFSDASLQLIVGPIIVIIVK